MKRLPLLLLVLVCACSISCLGQTGTTFWFACPEVSLTGSFGLDRPIYLRMTALSTTATVTISQPAGGGMPTAVLTIPAGTTSSFNLTPWIDILENKPANTILNYGIEIQSTAPITAYYDVVGGATCLCNPEDFVLKGDNALGTSFWIPGQDTLNNNLVYYSPIPTNAFDIVATQNATTVTITPSNDIVGHAAGTTFTVMLNKGQTYSATAVSANGPEHLHGSRVTADKPIAITEKDDLLHFGPGSEDLIGDQIVPVNVLGTDYIPMYGNLSGSGDKLFITATQSATTVSLNGVTLTTLSAGQTFRMNCPNPSGYLHTSLPAYVYQLSGVDGEVGSALLPQINCTGSNTVSFQQSSTIDPKLNLLVKSAGIGGFLVNGVAGVITSSMFAPVPTTAGMWYSAQVTLPVAAYPIGTVLTISNAANLFQLGFLSSGPPVTGADFGYFSNYGGLDPNASTTNPNICVGDSIRLFSDSFASASYLWTGPNSFTSTLQDPFIPGSTLPDSGIYKIVVQTPGCIDSSTVNVAVHPFPVVNIGNDTTVCTGASFSLHSSNTYTGASYLWNTGSTAPAISPTASGVYWLAVTTNGCTSADTAMVTLSASPPINLGDDTAFCTGNSLLLAPAIPGGSTITWSTGASSPSITVGTTGTYWIHATSGGCVSADTIHITVSPGVPVHLGNDTSVCTGTTLTLHSSDPYSAPSYLWNSGSTAPTLNPATSGFYWLHVTEAGCTGGDTVSVTFLPTPTVNLGDDTTFCAPDSLVLAPALPGDVSFIWSTGATTQTIPVNTTGTYWIRLNEGGCLASDTIHVVVNPMPVVNLGPDDSVCTGTAIVLQSSVSYTAPVYLWSTGSNAASISPATTNAYWLSVTQNGCKGADTVNVTFKPMPSVALGNDTTICDSAVITLSTGQEQQGATYSWNTGSNDATIPVSSAGLYKLTVTLDGCAAADSITVNTLRKPNLELGNDTVLCNGAIFQLTAGTDTVLWSNNTQGTEIKVTDAGKYWATAQNRCGIVSDTVTINYELCDIVMPTAFTPNDDGKDDFIRPLGHFQNLAAYELDIYNRWGQRIYYGTDPYTGWDGKFNGVKQDIGTYFYMLYYTFDGKKHMMKGDIELVK